MKRNKRSSVPISCRESPNPPENANDEAANDVDQ